MQNDEYTPDLELEAEQNQEELEETSVETNDTDSQEEVDWKAEALKWQAIAKRKAKQVEKPKVEARPERTLTDTPSREELILIAKGMEEEDLDQLKVIAKGKGISLKDAEKDPLFEAYYSKVQKERKAEQAKLGASRGSGYQKNQPDFANPNLSEDEHRKLFEQAINNR